MKKTWLIGICCTGADGVYIEKINGTAEEVKEYLLRLVKEEKAENEGAWEF